MLTSMTIVRRLSTNISTDTNISTNTNISS